MQPIEYLIVFMLVVLGIVLVGCFVEGTYRHRPGLTVVAGGLMLALTGLLVWLKMTAFAVGG